MNKVFEELEQWGCDVAGTKRRFLNDDSLYMACLNGVLDDNSFERLGEALKKQDCKQAFEATHNIKGFLANMGLTPMYDIAIQIMEPLRKGTVTGHEENYKALMECKEKLARIMNRS